MEERNKKIIEMYDKGMSYSQIAYLSKISRERVRQILNKEYKTNLLSEQHVNEKWKKLNEVRKLMRLDIRNIAQNTEVGVSTVSRILNQETSEGRYGLSRLKQNGAASRIESFIRMNAVVFVNHLESLLDINTLEGVQ